MRIIGKGKAVVEQEARVALLPIGVKYFCAGRDFLEALNDKPLAVVAVVPTGLFGHVVVEHIGQRNKSVSFDAINHHTKHPRTHQQPCLHKFFKGKSGESGVNSTHHLIVFPKIFLFCFDELEEASPLELF